MLELLGPSHVHSENKSQTKKNVCSDKRKIPPPNKKIGERGRERLKEDIVFPASKHFILLYNRQENKLLFAIFPTISILTD